MVKRLQMTFPILYIKNVCAHTLSHSLRSITNSGFNHVGLGYTLKLHFVSSGSLKVNPILTEPGN